MPRNGSGTFTLAEPPFVPQTPISSAAVNSDLSDIAAALTGSLARDGQGGMTAELPLANAGFSYTSDPNTGMHRTGADAQAIECGGVDIIDVDASGATVNGDLEVTGTVTSGGVAILPIGLGPLPWSGTAAPAKWLLCRGQSLLRASYPDLWAFASSEIALGNILFTNGNGTTTFTIADMSGGAPFGSNNGTDRLTTANSGVNGDVLGSVAGLPNPVITTANLPAYTPSGGVSLSLTSTIIDLRQAGGPVLTTSISPGGSASASFGPTAASITTGGTGTFTGNAQGGTSTPIKTQPRTVITNYIIYAGD